jgi:LemA protein
VGGFYLFLALLGALAIAFAVLYNRLVRLRNRVDSSWAQVDVQLRRRYDLIPNLVATVKGYAEHEHETLQDVTHARAAAEQAETVPAQAEAENVLTSALGKLFAVAEAYPQLRATENFQQLQAQLGAIEGSIAVARQIYNDSVMRYDNATQSVPSNVVAWFFGFEDREYFQIDDPSREAPAVQFSAPPSATPAS